MIGWRKHSRRAFMGGAAATVALPFLESAVPRGARAQAAAPRRFVAFYVPNGIRMSDWTPAEDGAAYTLPPILAPLGDLKSEVLVLTGLANRPARPDGPGDHASGTGAFLTCAHPKKTEGSDIQNGISLDQRLAQVLGDATTLPSLQLGIDGGSSAGGCDSGYSCAYARNVSWAAPATPLPKIVNPRVAFDRLFAGFDATASAEEQGRRRARRLSLLDYVRADARQLSARLGARDRAKLDEYLSGVRALERRIEGLDSGPSCDPGASPLSDLAYVQHVQAMNDLIVTALQCDVTRIVTFMLGNAGSNRTYEFLGVSGGHHQISHHQSDPANLDALTTIDIWELEQLAYLLGRMQAIDEGGSGLLDNSAVFFSSEIEDGDTHSHYNMPILLAGRCGGAFSPGRHVRYPNEPSVGSLFVSILHAMGIDDTRFGDDGDGPLDNLS